MLASLFLPACLGTASGRVAELAENPAAQPEWNMFGNVIPACGIYLRHAQGVTLANVVLSTFKPDFRPPHQLVDVAGLNPGDLTKAVTVANP